MSGGEYRYRNSVIAEYCGGSVPDTEVEYVVLQHRGKERGERM